MSAAEFDHLVRRYDETVYSEGASVVLLRVASEQHYTSALQKCATK